MHIIDINNPKEFFDVIANDCKGQVYLTTDEGDKLNLKSKLSQILAVSNIFNANSIGGFSIETELEEDYSKIFNFLVRG